MAKSLKLNSYCAKRSTESAQCYIMKRLGVSRNTAKSILLNPSRLTLAQISALRLSREEVIELYDSV